MASSGKVAGSPSASRYVGVRGAVGYHYRAIVLTRSKAERIRRSRGVVRTARANLEDWGKLNLPRQIGYSSQSQVMTFIVKGWTVLKRRKRIARIARIVAERRTSISICLCFRQCVISPQREMVNHLLPVAEVHAVVARTTNRLLVADAGKNRLSSRRKCCRKRTCETICGIAADRQLRI